MKKKDAGRTRISDKVDVHFQYTEDLSQVNLDIASRKGDELSAQDILDAVAETLLLHYDKYDLNDLVPEDYDS